MTIVSVCFFQVDRASVVSWVAHSCLTAKRGRVPKYVHVGVHFDNTYHEYTSEGYSFVRGCTPNDLDCDYVTLDIELDILNFLSMCYTLGKHRYKATIADAYNLMVGKPAFVCTHFVQELLGIIGDYTPDELFQLLSSDPESGVSYH